MQCWSLSTGNHKGRREKCFSFGRVHRSVLKVWGNLLSGFGSTSVIFSEFVDGEVWKRSDCGTCFGVGWNFVTRMQCWSLPWCRRVPNAGAEQSECWVSAVLIRWSVVWSFEGTDASALCYENWVLVHKRCRKMCAVSTERRRRVASALVLRISFSRECQIAHNSVLDLYLGHIIVGIDLQQVHRFLWSIYPCSEPLVGINSSFLFPMQIELSAILWKHIPCSLKFVMLTSFADNCRH